MENQRHIMAIAAHIGDAELTCGKTLAKHSVLGHRITTVGITAGERGAPPDRDFEEFKQHNIASATRFAEMLGGKHICMGYADGEIPDNEQVRLELCDIIRREKPNVILTHWTSSLHKDHIMTSKIVTDAIFYAALRGLERENPPHWSQGPYYAENWEDANGFVPYIYVDVSDGYELWHKAIGELWLTYNSPWFKYMEYYDALSRQRGVLIKKQRAECFAVDPYSMKVVRDSL